MAEEKTESVSEERALNSAAENREAVSDLIRNSRRGLAIFSRHLDQMVYDSEPVLDAISELARSGPFAKVRILVLDGRAAQSHGNRLIELGRSLSSYVEFRKVAEDYSALACEYVVGDELALVYRPMADRYEGAYFPHDGMRAREQLKTFELVWDKSSVDPEMRRLGI